MNVSPFAPDRGDEEQWMETRGKIGIYMELLFILNSARDKEVWQYVVGVAAHLEYLALAVLWIADGRPKPFPEYEERMALGTAANRIEQLALLDDATIAALKDIARLRNSVAHRGAVYGVTVAGEDPNHPRGVYRGGHVFSDLEALKRLVADADAAINAIGAWLKAHGAYAEEPRTQ